MHQAEDDCCSTSIATSMSDSASSASSVFEETEELLLVDEDDLDSCRHCHDLDFSRHDNASYFESSSITYHKGKCYSDEDDYSSSSGEESSTSSPAPALVSGIPLAISSDLDYSDDSDLDDIDRCRHRFDYYSDFLFRDAKFSAPYDMERENKNQRLFYESSDKSIYITATTAPPPSLLFAQEPQNTKKDCTKESCPQGAREEFLNPETSLVATISVEKDNVVERNMMKRQQGFKKANEEKEPTQARKERGVQFSTIEIREYPITLGDNPGGRSGPPISLGWDYSISSKMNLDTYESRRDPTIRRSISEFYISSQDRVCALLKTDGCSMKDIFDACATARSIRKDRRQNIE